VLNTIKIWQVWWLLDSPYPKALQILFGHFGDVDTGVMLRNVIPLKILVEYLNLKLTCVSFVFESVLVPTVNIRDDRPTLSPAVTQVDTSAIRWPPQSIVTSLTLLRSNFPSPIVVAVNAMDSFTRI
jgi:hypothetical protein